MRYEILVEGGFTGIAKRYKGEVPEEDISQLVELMGMSRPTNSKLRDGLVYQVTLFDHDKSIEAHFEENNLPEIFRNLIAN